MSTNELEILNSVLTKVNPIIQRGLQERLPEGEVAQILAMMLFEITNRLPDNKLIELRDYDDIRAKGTFRYSGQADTMLQEGLIPEDVYTELGRLGIDRHMGPSYLRVKGLLTHVPTREFFGKQLAFVIRDYLKTKPLSKPDGFLVCIPNMTGGAWIGDETGRQLADVTDYKVWPATPYARETRKAIDVIPPGERLVDYVEGLMPSPQSTSAIFCFEELRTAAETTQNATNIYRGFGYNEGTGVRIVEACLFDYGHPVGVERIRRLGLDRLYLVDGKVFVDASRNLGYASDSQHQTYTDWLNSPWDFTRRVLPDVVRLAGR